VLGPDVLSSLYFPSYVSTGRINIGDFLTRIEASSAVGFVITIFIKASLCLYVVSNGVAKVFNLKSYRSVVLQLGLLMVYFSDFIYKDIMEMQYFTNHIMDLAQEYSEQSPNKSSSQRSTPHLSILSWRTPSSEDY